MPNISSEITNIATTTKLQYKTDPPFPKQFLYTWYGKQNHGDNKQQTLSQSAQLFKKCTLCTVQRARLLLGLLVLEGGSIEDNVA